MKAIALAIAATGLTLSSWSVCSANRSQTAPCLTDSAGVHSKRSAIETQLFHADSASLVQFGLPYRPPLGTVTLVTDSAICAAAIAGYNATGEPADTVGIIAAAYVFRIGPSAFVVAQGAILVFLDANYVKLFSLAQSGAIRGQPLRQLAAGSPPSRVPA